MLHLIGMSLRKPNKFHKIIGVTVHQQCTYVTLQVYAQKNQPVVS